MIGGWRAVLAAGALLLLAGAASAADTRSVTDSAGRRAEVPARVERVYAAGGPASIFLYTLAPEKMLGWNRPPSAEERAFVPARFAELPTLGRLTGRGNTANVEGYTLFYHQAPTEAQLDTLLAGVERPRP